MEARLQKWGNSIGIRIPSNIIKSMKLKTNDLMDIFEQDSKIVITKSKRSKISLEERFKEYNGKNLVEPYDWGKPMGKEIW